MKKLLQIVLLTLSFGVVAQNSKSKTETITLGGGCYWCVEAVYENLSGVKSVISGFSGGKLPHPTYKQVSKGNTGYVEVVQIRFDPTVTNLYEIFKVFFTVHDPTTLNQQGADIGTQYRSVIFYKNAEQKKAAEYSIAELNKAKVYNKPIVTSVEPYTKFYKAEEDHQNYYAKNKNQPYCKMVIQPKIKKFEEVFRNKLKN